MINIVSSRGTNTASTSRLSRANDVNASSEEVLEETVLKKKLHLKDQMELISQYKSSKLGRERFVHAPSDSVIVKRRGHPGVPSS
jgi:hypothetical protein